MKKIYNVRLHYTTHCDIKVEANNEEEAIEKAYGESSGSQLIDNLQENDSPEVEILSEIFGTDIRMDNIRLDQVEKIKSVLEMNDADECEFENCVAVISGNKAYNIVGVEYIKEYGDGVSLSCEDGTHIYALQTSSDLTPIIEAIRDVFSDKKE